MIAAMAALLLHVTQSGPSRAMVAGDQPGVKGAARLPIPAVIALVLGCGSSVSS